MATASSTVVEHEEFRVGANVVPDNSLSCYTFVFGRERRQPSHFCSVYMYSNSRDEVF